MFSEDGILIYDRVLQNDPFLISGFIKEAIDFAFRGTYAGMRNINKMRLGDVEIDLQGVLKSVHLHPDTVLLKKPGLYCFRY